MTEGPVLPSNAEWMRRSQSGKRETFLGKYLKVLVNKFELDKDLSMRTKKRR